VHGQGWTTDTGPCLHRITLEMCSVGAEGAEGSNEEACIKPGSIKPLPEQKIKTKPKPKPKPLISSI